MPHAVLPPGGQLHLLCLAAQPGLLLPLATAGLPLRYSWQGSTRRHIRSTTTPRPGWPLPCNSAGLGTGRDDVLGLRQLQHWAPITAALVD